MAQSLSYEELRHFGLFRDPFAHPESRDEVFPSHNLKMAETAIVEAAERHQFTAIIGGTGSGKSTARDSALDRLSRQDEIMVIWPQSLFVDRMTAPGIVSAMLLKMGETPRLDLTLRSLLIQTCLEGRGKNRAKTLLLLEEAHLLHYSTLRALKRVYEIQEGFRKLLGICLVGQEPLIRTLNSLSMREVGSRCRQVEMVGMSVEEIGAYLNFRIQQVRQDSSAEEIFTAEAIQHIAARAQYPQEVNNVAREQMSKAHRFRNVDPGKGKRITREILSA